MSLINDALKAAQRERSGRGDARTTGPLVGNIFPYPDARSSSRPSWLIIVAVATTVIVLIAGGVVVRDRVAGPSSAKPRTPQTKSAPAPPTAIVAAPVTAQQKARPQADLSRPAMAKPTVIGRVPVATEPAAAIAQAAPRSPTAAGHRTKASTDSIAPRSTPASRTARSSPTTLPAAPPDDADAARPAIDPGANGRADSLFRLAYSEHMKSNLDGAQALYEKAIATRRAPAEAYNDYGVLLLTRGNKTAATEMFRQALNRDDKNVEAWVNLGDSFIGMGYHAEAMSAYARANQLDPARAAVKMRISRAYEAIGDTASARRYLEDAIKANPKDAATHYALGAYLQRAHDYQRAIREFQSFVDLSPPEDDQEFVIEMRRHISALGRTAP